MEQQQLFIKMALHSWDTAFKRTDKAFQSLTDEQLMQEIAPGRNRGIYILGHLIAVNDSMLRIMGLGERTYASLDQAFISNPDRAGFEMPSPEQLRQYWADLHQRLNDHFSKMTPVQWFEKHQVVSEEDFKKEPHRNKLSVLMNRTNHLSYHAGQLALIK